MVGIVYGSVEDHEASHARLQAAIHLLLQPSTTSSVVVEVLWSISYVSNGAGIGAEVSSAFDQDDSGQIITLRPPNIDIAFDDNITEVVRSIWERIMGTEAELSQFMRFEEREQSLDNE